MKNVSKLALFVAAGMMTAGAQAADFEVSDETTVSVFGEMELRYKDENDSDGNGQTDFSDEGSLVGIGVEHALSSNLTAFFSTELEFDVLGESDDIGRGAGSFGLEGDFGTLEIGDVDSVAEDALYDPIDPFESASPTGEDYSSADSMVTFFSPSMNGLEIHAQARIKDDGDQDVTNDDGDITTDNGTEVSLIGALIYDLGAVTLRAAYDNRGSVLDEDTNYESEDPIYGVSATFDLTDALEVSVSYREQENVDNSSVEATAIGAVYDYGQGDIYGTLQDVSPDAGDSRTELALGVDYTLIGDLNTYAEYAAYDKADDADDIIEVGLRFEF